MLSQCRMILTNKTVDVGRKAIAQKAASVLEAGWTLGNNKLQGDLQEYLQRRISELDFEESCAACKAAEDSGNLDTMLEAIRDSWHILDQDGSGNIDQSKFSRADKRIQSVSMRAAQEIVNLVHDAMAAKDEERLENALERLQSA